MPNAKFKIVVCGDRYWKNRKTIYDRLMEFKKEHGLNLLVASGGATGADSIARDICLANGIDFIEYHPNWKGRGLPAGPFRNQLMFDMIQPDLVVAFHTDLENSKGTKNMVEYAKSKRCTWECMTKES